MGAALAIAVAAPQLLAGWGARAIEEYLESFIDADVDVYDLELHWTQPQRARQVVVTAANSERVLEFSLRLPSLFDLLEEPTTEWFFRISDAQITARVDADGTSDLGRVFGQTAADGRTELELLGGLLAREFEGVTAQSSRGSDGLKTRSIRAAIQISEARFIELSSGVGPDRREAVVTDAVLVATRSRVGLQVDLKDAAVIGNGMPESAMASIALNFGPANQDEPWRLRSANLSLDSIPLDVLRLMGVVRRQRDGEASVRVGGRLGGARPGPDGAAPGAAAITLGGYGSIAAAGVDGFNAFLEQGAAIEARYGPLDEASGTADVTLQAAGSVGEIALYARHVDGMLVGEPELGEENAISAGFRLSPGVLERVFTGLTPEERVVITDQRSDARWYLRSRDFRIPLAASALTPGAFFGSGPGALAAPPRGASSPGGRRVVRSAEGAARGALTGALAGALRRSHGLFYLSSRGGSAASVGILPRDAAKQRGFDRLDWTHSLTELRFAGDLGANLRSRWNVAQSMGDQAEISVSIPSAALMPDEDLSPRLDVDLPELSLALLGALVPVPDDLAALLPPRFTQFEIKGLRLPLGPSRARLGPSPPVEINVLMGSTERVKGVFDDNRLTIPKANLSTELTPAACEGIILAYMPWLEGAKPIEEGASARDAELPTIRIEMSELVVHFTEGELRQEGEVILRSSPLLVRLRPELAQKLSSGEDDNDDGWIAWTPAPTRLSLGPTFVRYDRVELPLSDDYVTVLDGSFDRQTESFNLQGLVESSFIEEADNVDALRQVVIVSRKTDKGRSIIVGLEAGAIDPDLVELMQKATDLGDKK